ncbi:DUF6497 family protein [Roseisalinus antarcticus]|uniref:Acetolactate synthase n=1 Tax=Roseisalinus antarcticus TaxID=254357 RepID=A0A1Y5SSE2_9RHOB|nr:DUF6497 family protein [Roseisalinus antarcticus]SLN47312.1 hypothetical protein ROA7023_01977 [Roseisalinus antarcticus]
MTLRRPVRSLFLSLGLALTPAAAAMAADLATPTGQSLTLYDVVLEPETGVARFLFLAPGITLDADAGPSYSDVQADFPWLCDEVIVPALRENGWGAEEVVISMSDRQVDFGVSDPEATQFFEVFSLGEDGCTWEGF